METGGYLREVSAKLVEALGLNSPWVAHVDRVLFVTAKEADKARGELTKTAHLREPVLGDDGKTVSVSIDFPKRLSEIWKRESTKLCIIPHGVVEIAFAIDAAGISKKAISCTTVCGSISNNHLSRSLLSNAEVHTLGNFKDSDYEEGSLHLSHFVNDCKVHSAASHHPRRTLMPDLGCFELTPSTARPRCSTIHRTRCRSGGRPTSKQTPCSSRCAPA
jgi:hypothetical protein